MNIIIQDKFLNIEECIFLIKQYEYVRRIKEEQKNPIKPFENHFYPWNHSYQGNNQGNCPVWLSKKINNLAIKINDSVIDWIETVKWYSPCPGKSLHVDDASEETTLSCVIYLNDDYGGGQTYFEDGTLIMPKAGRALFFEGRQHRHGVTNLDYGTRYNISCWLKKS